MRVLLVEDSPQLEARLSISLKEMDYTVDSVAGADAANDALSSDRFELVILDLELADGDALEVLRYAKASAAGTRIFVLGSQGGLDDISAALDRGAEDFLMKPVALEELRLRLSARAKPVARKERRALECGPVILDQMTRVVTLDGKTLELTPRERAVLEVLLRNAGSVISKEFIASRVFSFDDDVEPAAIEIYIHRIRRKTTHPEFKIRTIRGLGYELDTRKASKVA